MSQSGSAAQFRQLPMFMTAQEVKNEVIPGDFEPRHFGVPQNVDDMWSRKRRESEDRGLHESIRRNGIQTPIDIWHYDDGPLLAEGHHRVASAHSLSRNYLIPVEHTERQRGPYEMAW